MLAALTGAGLSAAAGLNAFIPLLIVGVFARFTSFIELPEHLLWLESWPAIILSAVFLASEIVLDKIPGVDHINDLIQTAVRPLVGGVIFAATAAADVVDQSNFWQENPLVAGIVGAVVASLVHVGKAAARPAVNASTGGTGAPLASFAEDATAVGLSFIAIFIPVLVFFVFIAMGVVFYRIVTSGRRRRKRRALREAEERYERELAAEEEARREPSRFSRWRTWGKQRLRLDEPFSDRGRATNRSDRTGASDDARNVRIDSAVTDGGADELPAADAPREIEGERD